MFIPQFAAHWSLALTRLPFAIDQTFVSSSLFPDFGTDKSFVSAQFASERKSTFVGDTLQPSCFAAIRLEVCAPCVSAPLIKQEVFGAPFKLMSCLHVEAPKQFEGVEGCKSTALRVKGRL